jgi:acyl-CoA thioesterase FadM
LLELYPVGGEADWLRSFRFAVDVRPRFCETDALGHVSNTVYTTYWELARLQYLAHVGEADDSPRRTFPFNHLAVEIAMRLLRPCFYDEPLRVHALAAGDEIRAIARIAFVASDGERSIPWTPGQRAKLAAFEGRALPAP